MTKKMGLMALVLSTLVMMTGCSGIGEVVEDYDSGSSSSSSTSSSSSSTSSSSYCTPSNSSPYGDVQVDSQCLAACSWLDEGYPERAKPSCDILDGLGVNANSCGACSGYSGESTDTNSGFDADEFTSSDYVLCIDNTSKADQGLYTYQCIPETSSCSRLNGNYFSAGTFGSSSRCGLAGNNYYGKITTSSSTAKLNKVVDSNLSKWNMCTSDKENFGTCTQADCSNGFVLQETFTSQENCINTLNDDENIGLYSNMKETYFIYY